MENDLQNKGETIREFTLGEVQNITNNFSEEQIIGRGGYGIVYKGVIDNGKEIVLKKLHCMPGLDDTVFQNEFTNLAKARHKNITRLVGYCYDSRRQVVEHNGVLVLALVEVRVLCTEYLPSGCLDKYLSDESCGMDWHVRYKIIKGVCEGLNYLHNGHNDPIYHMDLKPANILLDNDMTPKIGDFGLSRLFPPEHTFVTTKNLGTVGYMPPEYIERNEITSKYDVFSLGVVVIRIVAGHGGYSKYANVSPQEFVEHVHENWRNRPGEIMSSRSSEEVLTCLQIALKCVEVDRVRRPTISEIVIELNKIDTVKSSSIREEMVDATSGVLCIHTTDANELLMENLPAAMEENNGHGSILTTCGKPNNVVAKVSAAIAQSDCFAQSDPLSSSVALEMLDVTSGVLHTHDTDANEIIKESVPNAVEENNSYGISLSTCELSNQIVAEVPTTNAQSYGIARSSILRDPKSSSVSLEMLDVSSGVKNTHNTHANELLRESVQIEMEENNGYGGSRSICDLDKQIVAEVPATNAQPSNGVAGNLNLTDPTPSSAASEGAAFGLINYPSVAPRKSPSVPLPVHYFVLPPGVGKSDLFSGFSDGITSGYMSNMVIDFNTRTLELDGKWIKLHICDTVGKERFRTIITAYYRGAMGVLLVYDVSKESSFNNITMWKRSIERHNKDVNMILVGSMDEGKRTVPTSRGQALADEHGIKFFETCTETNMNVRKIFFSLIREIIQKLKRKTDNIPKKPVIIRRRRNTGPLGSARELFLEKKERLLRPLCQKLHFLSEV